MLLCGLEEGVALWSSRGCEVARAGGSQTLLSDCISKNSSYMVRASHQVLGRRREAGNEN